MLFSAILLSVYVVGTIGADVFHHSLHNHHDEEVHSSVAEKDPCHRAIYHGDTTDGCHHEAHFTETDACTYSHVVFQAQQLLTRFAAPDPISESRFFSTDYHAVPYTTCLQQLHLRGPPSI